MVDFDHQANTSKSLKASGLVNISDVSSSQILTESDGAIEQNDFVLVAADNQLSLLEKQPDKHNIFANNLKKFLSRLEEQFDFCIIDTNPNPDIRMIAALVTANFVLSPIQLKQEAVDGIAALYADIVKIRNSLNPNLEFIGVLPNMVEATPYQKENLAQLISTYFNMLIKTEANGFAYLPNRTALAEAQAGGLPLWELKKTSARDAWKDIKPHFVEIAHRLGVLK